MKTLSLVPTLIAALALTAAPALAGTKSNPNGQTGSNGASALVLTTVFSGSGGNGANPAAASGIGALLASIYGASSGRRGGPFETTSNE